MNIQQFQYVLAVAENRHFENAAKQCFVSQSTLSTMISRFEEEIGIRIFDRKKKPVGITLEGGPIIKQLRIITSEILHLEEIVKEVKGEISGILSIACIPTVAPYLLPRFLSGFSKKFPDLHLIIKENTTEEILQKLKSRELDIGITSVPNMDNELIEYPLYKEPFILYDHSGNSPDPVTTDDLDVENFWLLEEGHCMRKQILEICNKTNDDILPALNINFKAGSIGSLMHFVKAHNGKTLLPYLSLSDLKEAEKEQLSFFERPAPYRQIGLVVHHHFVKNKILELLQNEILSCLPKDPEITVSLPRRIHTASKINL